MQLSSNAASRRKRRAVPTVGAALAARPLLGAATLALALVTPAAGLIFSAAGPIFPASLLPAPARAEDARRLQPDPLRLSAPAKNYDLVHTTLDLRLDLDRGRVSGIARHRVLLLRDQPRHLVLHARDLDVSAATIDGVPARHEQRDQELWIDLASTAQVGAQLEVAVEYSAAPVLGMHFRRPSLSPAHRYHELWTQGEGEENRFWFPSWDHPSDMATYTGIFTVDAGIEVLSNGALEERTEVDGRVRFRYEQRVPHANYLVMVAAAPYEVFEQRVGSVPLQFWVPPGTGETLARQSFAVTAPAIAFLADYTATPYPWSKYAQVVVQDFLYGGMENSSATVLHMRCLVPAGERGARESDNLLVHEAAHQWFGDLMTCYGWRPMWLNEGFATYCNALYNEHRRGEAALAYFMDAQHAAVFGADKSLPRPLETSFFNRIDDEQSASVYSKGASVLHMLRAILGDAAFQRGVRLYCQRRAHTLVTTGEFQRDMEEATGESLDWFFQQWVYLAGHPRFAVEDRWDEAAGTLSLQVRQTQETTFLVPVFRVPVQVEAGWDGGFVQQDFWIDGAEATLTMSLPERPSRIVFDSGGWLLKELDFPRSQQLLLDQLGHARHFWGRIEAVRALGDLRSRDADVVQSLAHLLHGPTQWHGGEESLRTDVAAALGKIGGPAARDVLATQLAGAQDAPRVRMACATALQFFEADAEAERALRAALSDDPSRHVRAGALRSLVALRVDDASALCLAALRLPSDREVLRLAAVDGLATLDDVRWLDEVLRYAVAPHDRDLRLRAIEVAAKLASPASGEARGDRAGGADAVADRAMGRAADRVRDRLALCLTDPLARIRTAAGKALASLGSDRALTPLRRAVAAERDPDVRAALNSAVSQLEQGEPTTRP